MASSFVFFDERAYKSSRMSLFCDKNGVGLLKNWNVHGYKVSKVSDTAERYGRIVWVEESRAEMVLGRNDPEPAKRPGFEKRLTEVWPKQCDLWNGGVHNIHNFGLDFFEYLNICWSRYETNRAFMYLS